MVLEAGSLKPLCENVVARRVSLDCGRRQWQAKERQGLALAYPRVSELKTMRPPIGQERLADIVPGGLEKEASRDRLLPRECFPGSSLLQEQVAAQPSQ